MVEVVYRSRWLKRHDKQGYAFETEASLASARAGIASFFRDLKVRDLVVDEESISCRRGSMWGSVFSFVERHLKQEIVVALSELPNAVRVQCTYSVFVCLPDIVVPCHSLQREAERLEKSISAGATQTGGQIAEQSPLGDNLKAEPQE